MKELMSELRRRNVFRIAVAYVVVGWVVTEVASTVLPIVEAPQWMLKVILLLIVQKCELR